MKQVSLFFALFLSSSLAFGQTQQNIIQATGTTGILTSNIDSIRFSAAGDVMEIVFQDGAMQSRSIIAIDSVMFETFAGSTNHFCAASEVHNPLVAYGSMLDQEGSIYKTVAIGTQEWMAENLNTSSFRNGDVVPNITSDTEWGSTADGAWCYMSNGPLNECPYGKLYNWFAAADARNLCPLGWHVPSMADWQVLINYLGGIGSATAGGNMKSTGIQFWADPNIDATNSSGFSGLPGGFRYYGGFFFTGNTTAQWWSSSLGSSADPTRGGYSSVSNFFGYVVTDEQLKNFGCSVRCVRD